MTTIAHPPLYVGGTMYVSAEFFVEGTEINALIVPPVNVKIWNADTGVQVTGPATVNADGVWEFSFVTVAAGRHVVNVKSSGSRPAVAEGEIMVRGTGIPQVP